MSGKVTRQGW